MKVEGHAGASSSARLMLPGLALMAMAILAGGVAGEGVGVAAGASFALAIGLHALAYGAAAAQAALPAVAAKAVFAAGLIAAFAAPLAPARLSAQVAEAGVFALCSAGAALILTVLIARAPTLRNDK